MYCSGQVGGRFLAPQWSYDNPGSYDTNEYYLIAARFKVQSPSRPHDSRGETTVPLTPPLSPLATGWVLNFCSLMSST